MEQYIKKSEIVAEIERRIQDGEKVIKNVPSSAIFGLVQAYKNVLSFLDTLEVKEVEEPSNDLEEATSQSFIYHENHGDDFRSDKQIETAYRYGFKEGFKYKELTSLEIKEANLDKEIKDYFNNQPIITRSKSIDYQLIPSGEDIAKHFFELGLKAQKEK